MPRIDPYETEVLAAFEKGSLKSVATKAELSAVVATSLAQAPDAMEYGQALEARHQRTDSRRSGTSANGQQPDQERHACVARKS